MSAPPHTASQDRASTATATETYEWGLYYSPSVGGTQENDSSTKELFNNDIYALTKATTNPAHSTQIIDLTFFVSNYGYGDLNIGLNYSADGGSTTKTLKNQIWAARQGVATRRPGFGKQTFIVTNMPTDGSVWRIYPTVDTRFSSGGRVNISWGGYDSNNTTEKPFVLLEGRALPSTWRSVAPTVYPLLTPTGATASHGSNPENVFDGDFSARLDSCGDPLVPYSWIRLDFGSSKTFREVFIQWEGSYASSYKIQTSSDDTNWTDSITINKSNKNPDSVTLTSNNTGQYLRILGQSMVDNGMSIYEMEVRGE